MTARVFTLAPLAVIAALVAVATRDTALTLVAASLFALVSLVGGRLSAGPGAQRVAFIVMAVAGFFLSASLAPEVPGVRDRLTGVWCGLAMAFALPTLTRALFVKAEGGAGLTMALGVAAFALAGQVKVSPWQSVLGWAYVGACIASMRAEDLGRPRLQSLPRRRWLLGAVILGTSVASVAVAARVLPPLHAKAIERFMRAVRGVASTGFDEEFSLGSLESLLTSDELVARIYGPSPEMLRGVAYNRYQRGRWISVAGPGRVTRTRTGPLVGEWVTTVELMSAGARVYFAPLDHSELATTDGAARVDPLGVVWRVPGDLALRIWYRAGARDANVPTPPTADDTALPPSLAARVTPIARQWTEGARDDEDRVERLVRALRGNYRYRLAVRRSSRLDPVVDFLFVHREGNCEFFASATAVLARSVGVPARVVGGYRVGENNPLGGFHVVRERNAHAWVEVWDRRGRWVTVDPTPERAIPANLPHRSPWLRAAIDALSAALSRLRRAAAALTAKQLLSGAAALLAAWQAWRFWRARRGTREDRRTWRADERPLPCLPRLDAQLERRGLGRAPGETLERFAARVTTAETLAPELREEVAASLCDYAAARYGHGDVATAAARVDACAKRLEGAI